MAVSRRPGRISLIRLVSRIYPEADRRKIYAAILCGEILVNGERLRDSNCLVSADSAVRWVGEKFVGRGGYKLEGALDALGIDPNGLVCLDAGASTGGFTDCLLSRGAIHVHAVDVGYNQLAWKLRSDARVSVRERINLMSLSPGDLEPPPELAVADLSFRSLRGAASKLLELTAGGIVLSLVKPQYENPQEAGFDGVVRTREARSIVFHSLIEGLLREGVHVLDAVVSPLPGRKGNAEIFVRLSAVAGPDPEYVERRISQALDAADLFETHSADSQKSSRPRGAPTRKPSPPR